MTLSDPQPGFQGILRSRISKKRCVLGTKLLKNTNRKPCTVYRMVQLSMTLSDLWPHFKVTTFFEVEYRKKRRVLKTKLLLHNRKLYLTYRIVLCLVTLTDLETRRAALSASAELLVWLRCIRRLYAAACDVFRFRKRELRWQSCCCNWESALWPSFNWRHRSVSWLIITGLRRIWV